MNRRVRVRADLQHRVRAIVDRIPIDFGGGSSAAKALILAELVKRGRGACSVDIGVYRGRSLLPLATAHASLGRGRAIGVDPYSSAAAVERDAPELWEQLQQFASTTDFDAIYVSVVSLLKSEGLTAWSEIKRATSHVGLMEIADEGVEVGLVHVDGNHDTEIVLHDVEWALRHTVPGGFIVIDDISWRSVRPAVERVRQNSSLLFARVDQMNDFAVYRTPGGGRGNDHIRIALSALNEMGDSRVSGKLDT
ncbi:methyltransferase family protein [Microcella putealis]|uniref:Methyltransferase family protein n=1 Tax=Microcella putealis TaxID=337005 RepID=A0A4Q7LSY4_9MICO|nr:class I SAM-dependent methyltransferase [Microcella putealis]RZS57417.1 methyltransferase family protein [Microcella putealis]TQM19440.1 methyltransferase family protein [Microcella putealis]